MLDILGKAYTVLDTYGYTGIRLENGSFTEKYFTKVPPFTDDIENAQPGDIVEFTKPSAVYLGSYTDGQLYIVREISHGSIYTTIDAKGHTGKEHKQKQFKIVVRPNKSKEPSMEPQEQLRTLTNKDVKVGDTVTICTEDQFIELHGKDWRTSETLIGGWNPAMDRLFGLTYIIESRDNDYFFTAVDNPKDAVLSLSACVGYGAQAAGSVPTPSSKVSAAVADTTKPTPPKQYRKFLPKKTDPSPLEVWKGLCDMGKKESWKASLPTKLFCDTFTAGYMATKKLIEFNKIISVTTFTDTAIKLITDKATKYKITNVEEAFLVHYLASASIGSKIITPAQDVLATSKNPAIKRELNPEILYTPIARMTTLYKESTLGSVFGNLVIVADPKGVPPRSKEALAATISSKLVAFLDSQELTHLSLDTKIEIKV